MTTPETEVTNAQVEDRLFNLLSGAKEEDSKEQPSTEEAEPQEEAEEPAQETATEEVPEDDSEEVEFEGKTYQLPKELKRGLLREKDYTLKTQEVAEQRKALEDHKQFLQQAEKFQQATFKKAVELQALETQLERFNGVDWEALATADPAEFLKLDRAQRALQERASRAKGDMQQAWQAQQELTAKEQHEQLQRGQAELAKSLKGWGPDLAKRVVDNGKEYGFSERELATVSDPRYVKVLHDAMQWRTLQQAKPALNKRMVDVKPIKVGTSRSAPKAQQAAAVGDARQRLQKSGKARDAETYFERLLTRK